MNLLYDFNQDAVVENVTMKWPSDDYVIPAGTPMSRTGIANDGNAIGILASEARCEWSYPMSVAKLVGKKEPKGNKDHTFQIITGGFVNRSAAEKAFGAAYSDAAVSAMTGVKFMPDAFGGGSGGGGALFVDFGECTGSGSTPNGIVYTFSTDVANKDTWNTIKAALDAGQVVIGQFDFGGNHHRLVASNYEKNGYIYFDGMFRKYDYMNGYFSTTMTVYSVAFTMNGIEAAESKTITLN